MDAGETLLIYRKQLGDLLLLQPAIQHLLGLHGQPVRVRTRGGFTDLLDLMPGQVALAGQSSGPYRQVYCFDTKWSSLADALRAWPARRTLILTRPEKAWWHPLFFHRVIQADGRDDYRGRLFQRAVGGREFEPPRLQAPPREWLPQGLPENYLVVHPTSAWRRKTWPAAAWIDLLGRLLARHPCRILVTSGSEAWEREMADAIAAPFPGQVESLGGRTSLRAYLAVLAKATAVLTVDGSASHLAAAFGRPVLTLFGPTNPKHWHYPTQLSRCLNAGDFSPERKPAVDAIPVDAALGATLELLEGAKVA